MPAVSGGAKTSKDQGDGLFPRGRNFFTDHQAKSPRPGIVDHLTDAFLQFRGRFLMPAQRRMEPEELVGPDRPCFGNAHIAFRRRSQGVELQIPRAAMSSAISRSLPS